MAEKNDTNRWTFNALLNAIVSQLEKRWFFINWLIRRLILIYLFVFGVINKENIYMAIILACIYVEILDSKTV